MGRGRAKAKQTKVARELKYSSPSTDLTALQRELAAGDGSVQRPADDSADDLDGADDLEDDDTDESWVASR
jgi:hypothetical protein